MKIINTPDLADYSSIHIGGLGNFLYQPETESEVVSVLNRLDNPYIIGGGTNVIFADGFKNDIISLGRFQILDISCSENAVSVSAGVKLSRLVYEASGAGYAGCEALAGIPGTIGGAVVMNAGSRYGDISQYLVSVRVYSKQTDSIHALSRSEMEFGYRKSILQENKDLIVLGAELYFPESAPALVLREKVKRIIGDRITSKIKLPNCGSVFKNPDHEFTAGAMIDRLGLKGYRIGGIGVSELHGNIFVNHNSGTYNDFNSLCELIAREVKKEYNVELELEIRVLR